MKKTLLESAERFFSEDELLAEANTSEYKLLVTYMSKEITEDSYEEGEIGQRQLVQEEKIGKKFDSFDAFKKYCADTWSLDEADGWSVIDNRLIYSCMETEEGHTPFPNETEQWKQGKKTLYSADYDFSVELVTSISDEDNIREWTGIKN